MTRKVTVKPISSKAKNRLVNVMGNNPVCIVEQDINGKLFLASENQKYFFWTPTEHWEVITEIKDVI